MYITNIAISSGPHFFTCLKCNKQLSCAKDGVTSVKRHEQGEKHVKRCQESGTTTNTLPKILGSQTSAIRKIRQNEIK